MCRIGGGKPKLKHLSCASMRARLRRGRMGETVTAARLPALRALLGLGLRSVWARCGPGLRVGFVPIRGPFGSPQLTAPSQSSGASPPRLAASPSSPQVASCATVARRRGACAGASGFLAASPTSASLASSSAAQLARRCARRGSSRRGAGETWACLAGQLSGSAGNSSKTLEFGNAPEFQQLPLFESMGTGKCHSAAGPNFTQICSLIPTISTPSNFRNPETSNISETSVFVWPWMLASAEARTAQSCRVGGTDYHPKAGKHDPHRVIL